VRLRDEGHDLDALHRPGADGLWHPTAALVIEILSPADETIGKLPFYAAHAVDEILIVDPTKREVNWLALRGGRRRPAPPRPRRAVLPDRRARDRDPLTRRRDLG
jgi:hypothetical protein